MTGAAIQYPSADQVARAVVTAARLCDEDPIACVGGAHGLRSRYYVMRALHAVFPDVLQKKIASYVGVAPSQVAEAVRRARKSELNLKWWNRRHLQQVIDAVKREPKPAPPPRVVAAKKSAPFAKPVVTPPPAPARPRAAAAPHPIDRDRDQHIVRRGAPLRPAPILHRAPRVVGLAVKPPRRVVVTDLASDLMGDPPPGRSALDRSKPD